MRVVLSGATALCALLSPLAAQAATNVATGTFNGLKWTAQSQIIGQTSTATIAGGGNPIYLANTPRYSGVAALIMTYASGAQFICSGSLMTGGTAIVTAGHCVTPSAGTGPLVSTTAYFGGGQSPSDFYNGTGTVAVNVGRVTINPLYTGEVIDQNDIAVLALSTAAPAFAAQYGLYTAGDLTGKVFNVAGYGARSDGGGSVGANLGAGRLRQGTNEYDFRLGDAALGGGLDFLSDNGAQIAYSYLSDFDNGNAANDSSCIIADAVGVTGSQFCSFGLGASEVTTGGGDSGGPQFITGKLASITSYGLTFGSDYGDTDDKLNDTFGEFSGFVPTYIHEKFILAAIAAGVPEPGTWMQMIFGFGLVGGVLRNRKSRTRVTYA